MLFSHTRHLVHLTQSYSHRTSYISSNHRTSHSVIACRLVIACHLLTACHPRIKCHPLIASHPHTTCHPVINCQSLITWRPFIIHRIPNWSEFGKTLNRAVLTHSTQFQWLVWPIFGSKTCLRTLFRGYWGWYFDFLGWYLYLNNLY